MPLKRQMPLLHEKTQNLAINKCMIDKCPPLCYQSHVGLWWKAVGDRCTQRQNHLLFASCFCKEEKRLLVPSNESSQQQTGSKVKTKSLKFSNFPRSHCTTPSQTTLLWCYFFRQTSAVYCLIPDMAEKCLLKKMMGKTKQVKGAGDRAGLRVCELPTAPQSAWKRQTAFPEYQTKLGLFLIN